MENNFDLMLSNELSKDANGGTEQMQKRLYGGLVRRELLEQTQIFFSRVRGGLDHKKVRIFYAHDLPGDPEASAALSNEGWERFHRVVFVSYTQMIGYIQAYQIPWSKCVVMKNAVDPIDVGDNIEKFGGRDGKISPIRLIYTSTPHRGLSLLVPVFKKLLDDGLDVEMDVFSSFGLYGWPSRDIPFQTLLDECIEHPKINYHAAAPNQEVREAVAGAHIFAYPSTWEETSCICLMEAMSGMAVPVHPDYGALPETGAGLTQMYHWHEDPKKHANIFYKNLRSVVQAIVEGAIDNKTITNMKGYADAFYDWRRRAMAWNILLQELLKEERGFPKPAFKFRT